MLTRLARWWLAHGEHRRRAREVPRSHTLVGECICGAKVAGPTLHLVVAMSEDDELLGIEGQTAMSADFCAEHCPGGCQHGCVPSEV